MKSMIRIIAQALAGIFGLIVAASAAEVTPRDKGPRVFSAQLSGHNEVHFSPGPPATLRGAISTKGTGSFSATLNDAGSEIAYELRYQNLEGEVTQAHIHFGQPSTVGGIIVWLCQTGTNPAPDSVTALTPACPPEGSVTGAITDLQVLEQTAQGIKAGDFSALIRALRAETAYANVHSTLHGPGEIRGQIGITRAKLR